MSGVSVAYNLIPVELIQRVKEIPRGNKTHRSNYSSWEQNIVKTSGPVMIYDIEGDMKDEIIRHVHKFMDMPVEGCFWYTMYYLGGRLSHIPWHNDRGHSAACSIYVNDTWDWDWGGALLYEESENDVRAVYPEFNKAITFKPPIQHATMMPSLDAPIRESIQIFVYKPDPNNPNAE